MHIHNYELTASVTPPSGNDKNTNALIIKLRMKMPRTAYLHTFHQSLPRDATKN